MNQKEKEIVELMKEWKDEIKAIGEDYSTAVAKLDAAATAFKNSTQSWFQRNRFWIMPILWFILAVFFVLCLSSWGNWCEFTFKFSDGVSVKKCN